MLEHVIYKTELTKHCMLMIVTPFTMQDVSIINAFNVQDENIKLYIPKTNIVLKLKEDFYLVNIWFYFVEHFL